MINSLKSKDAAFCTGGNAYSLYLEAMQMVQKHGAIIKSPNGYPVQSPYLSTANKQLEIIMRIASEFGFTPASRARIYSHSTKNLMVLNPIEEPDVW